MRHEWARFSKFRTSIGYKYGVTGSKPLTSELENTEASQALESGMPQWAQKAGEAVMAIPVSIRGEVIGVLNVRTPGERHWTQNEADIVQAVADRVAISAENARLFEETQRRAAKEQTIGDISAKISSSINLELSSAPPCRNLDSLCLAPKSSLSSTMKIDRPNTVNVDRPRICIS